MNHGEGQTDSGLIEEFAFYSRILTSASAPEVVLPELPEPVVASAWTRVLARVRAEIDEWEGTDDHRSPEGRQYSAQLTYSPGWVCLSVRHPCTDGPTQVQVMHEVARIIEEETRDAQ